MLAASVDGEDSPGLVCGSIPLCLHVASPLSIESWVLFLSSRPLVGLEEGPALMTSVNLSYLSKDPVSKYGHTGS